MMKNLSKIKQWILRNINKLYSSTESKLSLWNGGSSNYWETRYAAGGTSGKGSYGQLATYKANFVNEFIVKNEIKLVLEFGCGDGNQLNLLICDNYIGLDVSESVIKNCKKEFNSDQSKKFFTLNEFDHSKSKLVISLDVIFHLVEEEIFISYMQSIFSHSEKFVIIYSSNINRKNCRFKPHIRHRKFTDWIDQNKPDWKLISFVPNKFKYSMINRSFSDFFVYEKIDDERSE